MSKRRQQLGASGEQAARAFLEREGFRFRGGNVRTGYGEIDLLMDDHGTLVAVEVKTRRASATEVVRGRQLSRVARALLMHAAELGFTGPLRVDLVTVMDGSVSHLPGVFRSNGTLP